MELGEEVVTYGSFTIDAAAQLNNQTSMMNRNVSIEGVDHSEHLPDYTQSTSKIFKDQLFSLATSYLDLKDALVLTSQDKASKAANEVQSALSNVEMSLLQRDAHDYWMKQASAIKSHSEAIASSEDVEKQRSQFDFLSQALINSVKVFGIGSKTLYVQHCPMANDNEGADWLSNEEKIQNPYFGDKMMTCGLVQATIDETFKNPPMSKAENPRQNIHNH